MLSDLHDYLPKICIHETIGYIIKDAKGSIGETIIGNECMADMENTDLNSKHALIKIIKLYCKQKNIPITVYEYKDLDAVPERSGLLYLPNDFETHITEFLKLFKITFIIQQFIVSPHINKSFDYAGNYRYKLRMYSVIVFTCNETEIKYSFMNCKFLSIDMYKSEQMPSFDYPKTFISNYGLEKSNDLKLLYNSSLTKKIFYQNYKTFCDIFSENIVTHMFETDRQNNFNAVKNNNPQNVMCYKVLASDIMIDSTTNNFILIEINTVGALYSDEFVLHYTELLLKDIEPSQTNFNVYNKTFSITPHKKKYKIIIYVLFSCYSKYELRLK